MTDSSTYLRPQIINWAHPNGHRAYFDWNGEVGGVKMAGPVAVFGPVSARIPITVTQDQIHQILVGHARRIENYITDGEFEEPLKLNGWPTNEGALFATVVTLEPEEVFDRIFAGEPQSRDRFFENLSKEGRVVAGYFLVIHTEEVPTGDIEGLVDSL